MRRQFVYFWQRTPFVRFLVPLVAGIILQWYQQLPVSISWLWFAGSLLIMGLFFFTSFFQRFKFAWLQGVAITGMLISIGAILAWHNDIRQDKRWFGRIYNGNEYIIVTLAEPLTEKPKSLKADADVEYLVIGQRRIKVRGKIILYFQKDSSLPKLRYGSQIIFRQALQPLKNQGNPGGFDYVRYCLFQDITHQVRLKTGEFEVLQQTHQLSLNRFLYSLRGDIVSILKRNIKGTKESGLAEALLIGYKDDLDKTLVQSYSNTGVVHIVAISGMHLALIYSLINLVLKPISRRKKWKWIRPVIALSLLWVFSLLTGASSSVLRAAVMFTFILLADSLAKKPNIYNTLAASAFCLLCFNPYWLWDVGFQLSYAAVLSIVIFMKPIYNILFVKNKLLDHLWQLCSVTLAAQILTTPLSMFHFHQFPTGFLLTNLVAVPLSSIIVIGEIVLCLFSFIPFIASVAGKVLSWLILLMNSYVERIESLPGSLWDGLQLNVVQTILLFVVVAGIAYWLMEKIKQGLPIAMLALLGFFVIRSHSFMNAESQQEIIVYNVPQKTAIDFVTGRSCYYFGDPELSSDDFMNKLYLKPSRTLNRISPLLAVDGLTVEDKYVIFKGKKIVMADTVLQFTSNGKGAGIDLLIISNGARLSLASLTHSVSVKQIVFDASVSFRKLAKWKKDCDSLHIPYHDVSERGAFVMSLN